MPTILTAQVGGEMPDILAAHEDHAHLHRPGPAEAGVPLVAAEIIGLEDDARALCRAAEIALSVGLVTDPARADHRTAWFRRAEEYARRARTLAPRDPDALFFEAAALGLRAVHLPIRDRIAAGSEVLEMADSILAIDPEHAGALHLHGQLNAAAMRLNPMVRFLVGRVLGADVLQDASWASAEDRLRRSVEAEPANPYFRLELAEMLRDAGQTDAARHQLHATLELPGDDPLTFHFQERARAILAELD